MCNIEEYNFRRKTSRKLSRILSILEILNQRSIEMSQELDDLEIEVAESEDVQESAILLLEGIIAEIDSLIAEVEAGKLDAAKLVAMRDSLDAKKVALAAAVAAVPAP
jgi:hypothetical protein